MRCVVRRRGVRAGKVTIVVVDVPEPCPKFRCHDERDDRTSTGGGDDRTVAVSETIEPPPSSSSAATGPRRSVGRSIETHRAVEADVTRASGCQFRPREANGVDGDDEKDAKKERQVRGGGADSETAADSDVFRFCAVPVPPATTRSTPSTTPSPTDLSSTSTTSARFSVADNTAAFVWRIVGEAGASAVRASSEGLLSRQGLLRPPPR